MKISTTYTTDPKCGNYCPIFLPSDTLTAPETGYPVNKSASVRQQEDYKRLLADAAEGLSVAGRKPTWEAGRPQTLPVGEPNKVVALL